MSTGGKARKEDLASFYTRWKDKKNKLKWLSLFVTPPWLESWWDAFGRDNSLFLRSFWRNGQLTGMAPLMVKGKTAYIVGDGEVCDYLDFIVAEGEERFFFTSLLEELEREGIDHLEVTSMRADSPSRGHLVPLLESRGLPYRWIPEDVLLERELPACWGGYLELLNKKQRHEVRRKIRRLEEAGEVEYRWMESLEEVGSFWGRFMDLFTMSRKQKSTFLTPSRERFFRLLIEKMGRENILRMGVLYLNGDTAAAVLCFDDGESVYLYNSGYHPRYRHLSAGLLSKVWAVKESIERGRSCFSFLKGAEVYKYRLGGVEVPTCRLEINLQ